jgi:hypothetical protein
MCGDLPANHLDLCERALDRLRPGSCASYPDREKNRTQPALAHPGNVHRPISVALTQIEIAIYEPLRRVRVRVYDQRTKMKLASLGGDFGSRINRKRRQKSPVHGKS